MKKREAAEHIDIENRLTFSIDVWSRDSESFLNLMNRKLEYIRIYEYIIKKSELLLFH